MNKISKWHVLVGCFIAYFFDAIEIVMLSLSLPVIRQDMGLSINQGGLLATATLLGIGVSSVIAGWYADSFGRRKAMLTCLLVFGSLTAVLSFVENFYLFLGLRFLSGLGLGGLWGIVSVYIVESWPPHQRARATSMVISAFAIGAIVAALVAKYMLPEWRTMFMYAGGMVLIPVVYIYFLVPETPAWKEAKAQNTSLKKSGSIAEIFSPTLIKSTLLGTTAASFALLGYWGANTWLPTYLVQERGLSLSSMATFMAILNIGNFIGMNFFGYLADVIGKRKVIIISLVLTASMLPVYVYASNADSLLWLGALYAFNIAFASLFGAFFSELYPTHVRTLGAGFCFNAGRGLAALAPLLLSGIATYYSLAAGLMVCAAFFLISACFTYLMPDKPKVLAQDEHLQSNAAGAAGR
ncbi:MFS transporter [Pseudomonas sp. 008]|uniref:MFS transporter n=1 Tax=Pseudomonas sp. 008 TaxID=2803906 RepID=UPI00194FADBC|nr:MFS transporter [Pseudomonas sp. 008]GID03083.1 MFS transporter [Pseudomonas sp. 008]